MAAVVQNIRPNGRTLLFVAIAQATRPRRRLSVSEWADANRQLSTKSSSESGRWKTSRTPFLFEPMDTLSLMSRIQKTVLMFPTQSGKTEAGLNWIGYVMEHAPAPMLAVVPTLEFRKRWVKQRIDPMLSETRVLARIFNAQRKRDSANAEDIKDFPGGFLVIAGANSPASLSSMPIKYFLGDEIDRYPWEVGDEGDPLGLIRERQKTFPRRKECLISTPTMTGASRIEEEFLTTDQRYYHVPCVHCGELLVLRWANLHWNAALTEARYMCEHCGAEIEEHYKTEMLREGRWVPKIPDFTLPYRGYHLNALYSPLGLGFRWIELARMWVAAQADKAKLKRFINTSLAETYQDRSKEIDAKMLKERADPYGLRDIPCGCLILTCGVDVQGDRLAVQVVGWGRDEACWVIDWFELPGDPSRAELWNQLAEYLNRTFVNRFGKEMSIQATAIDTGGHHTHDVYNFVRSRRARRLMAIKGSKTPSRPILAGRPNAQDVNWKGQIIKGGVKLWLVGTDTAKHALVARLIGDATAIASASDAAEQTSPVIKIHFSDALPDYYYDQLTSEVFDPERNRWVQRRGRRNEALDTWVYAAAAAQHPEIRVHAMRASDWKRYEQMLEPASVTPLPAGTHTESQEESPAALPAKKKPPRVPRRAGGFVNRWK